MNFKTFVEYISNFVRDLLTCLSDFTNFEGCFNYLLHVISRLSYNNNWSYYLSFYPHSQLIFFTLMNNLKIIILIVFSSSLIVNCVIKLIHYNLIAFWKNICFNKKSSKVLKRFNRLSRYMEKFSCYYLKLLDKI